METLNQLITRLWLTPGAGPVFIKTLMSKAFGFDMEAGTQVAPPKLDPKELGQLPAGSISQVTGIPLTQVAKVMGSFCSPDFAAQELKQLEQLGARAVTLACPDYPQLLRQIYAPPPVITVRGTLPDSWARSISIVGSRKACSYAARSLDLLIPSLAASGFAVVSGGALGVDSLAHTKTVEAGGCTVVVLGSGLARPYPQANTRLFDQICSRGGAVVSTFPSNTMAIKGNFPARNRVVSGLTPACLVIQAADKSGALITASFATEQNRDVMAIPGPIDDQAYAGNNNLLRQGATLVTGPQDIVDHFGLAGEPIQIKTTVTPATKAQDTDPLLSLLERPVGLEELAQLSGKKVEALCAELFDLEMLGKVRQNLSGTWQRI